MKFSPPQLPPALKRLPWGPWSQTPRRWSHQAISRWRAVPEGPLKTAALPVLVALLLHSVWLATTPLRHSAPQAKAGLTAEDNSPELLRFSRQPPPVPPALTAVPLPGASTLPPPPPPEPDGKSEDKASAEDKPSAEAPAPNKGGVVVVRSSPARGPGSTARPAGATKPSGAAPAGQVIHLVPGTAKPTPSSEAAANLGMAATPNGPLATLLAAQRLASSSGSPNPNDSALAEAGLTGLQRPSGQAVQAYQALWNGAEAKDSGPGDLAALPPTVQLREMAAATANAQEVPTGHRQAVVLGNQLLLFWLEGDTLWLIRAPITP